MPILRYVHILLMRSASATCLSIYCVCVIIGRTCGAIATYRSYVASDSAHLDASSQCRIGAPRVVASLPPIDDVIVATEKRLFQSWRRCLRTVKRRGGPHADDGLLEGSLFVTVRSRFPTDCFCDPGVARASSSTSHLSHGALARHHAASCARRARHERVGLLAGRRSAAAWPTFSGRDAAAQAHRARPTAAELSRLSCSATIGHRSDA